MELSEHFSISSLPMDTPDEGGLQHFSEGESFTILDDDDRSFMNASPEVIKRRRVVDSYYKDEKKREVSIF